MTGLWGRWPISDMRFPIITRQLADLFAAPMEAHGLSALPGATRGLLRSEEMDDLIDRRRARFLNLSRYDELEISVRARLEVALEETACARNWVHDRAARPAVVHHTVPSPVMP